MYERRILLAEDDDEMRSLLTWRLNKEGFEVVECNHGIDLINQIDPITAAVPQQRFDLIISDIRMPGISGLEALEDARFCDIACPPVIFITAFGDAATHEEGRRLGAVAVFDKPFDFNELLAKVSELLSVEPSQSTIATEGALNIPQSPLEPHIPSDDRRRSKH